MQTLLYDATTKTVLGVDNNTRLYVNPDPTTVKDLEEDNPVTVFNNALRIFPNAGASPADLYRTAENTRKYLREITATAGRALLVRLARRIKELHGGTELVNLDSLFLRFVHTASTEDATAYQIESLAGEEGVVLFNTETIQLMIQDILGYVADFTLHELATYVDGRDTPVVRLPNMVVVSTLTWDPDDSHDLPDTIIVCLADLLEINQHV